MVKAVIRGDGFAVEIDATPSEYEAALTATLRAVQSSQGGGDDGLPSPSVLQALVERLSDEAVEYLRVLVEEPEGVSGDDLELMLDLSRQKLAGLNGSITKAGGTANLDIELIEKSISRTAEGKRRYFYKVPPSLRSRLANVLPEESEAEPEPAHPFVSPAPPPSDDDVPF